MLQCSTKPLLVCKKNIFSLPNILIFSAFFIGILFLLIGSFFDLRISKFLASPWLKNGQYYTSNIFSNFFEVIGCITISLIICFCINILGFNLKFINSKKLSLVLQTIVFCSSIAFVVNEIYQDEIYAVIDIFTNQKWSYDSSLQMLSICLALILGILIWLSTYLFIKTFSKETIVQLLKWSIISIAIITFTFFTVSILKNLLPRIRFRSIMYDFGGDLNRFQNWYELVHLDRDNVFAGIKTDHTKSFPSAHTSYTSSFLTLAFLPLFCNKFKTKKWQLFLFIAPIALVIIVAFSRVMAGAHYTSDVSMGFLIAFCFTVFFFKATPIQKFKWLSSNYSIIIFSLIPVSMLIGSIYGIS